MRWISDAPNADEFFRCSFASLHLRVFELRVAPAIGEKASCQQQRQQQLTNGVRGEGQRKTDSEELLECTSSNKTRPRGSYATYRKRGAGQKPDQQGARCSVFYYVLVMYLFLFDVK